MLTNNRSKRLFDEGERDSKPSMLLKALLLYNLDSVGFHNEVAGSRPTHGDSDMEGIRFLHALQRPLVDGENDLER
jgi:hypothetical protein